MKTTKATLTLNIEFEDREGEYTKPHMRLEIRRLLDGLIDHAAGMGMLTGDTWLEVGTYDVKVDIED